MISTMNIQFSVKDREYSQWSFQNLSTGEPVQLDISPTTIPLFHGDTFVYTMDLANPEKPNTIDMVSSIKTQPQIPAVLVLENNKTYGRTANQKKLLYKCIPDNPQLPIFLVPYEPTLGFLKKTKNKYILLKYDHWQSKHPYGIITETIGDVDQLDTFYEYQLHCRNLHISLAPLNKKARLLLSQPYSSYIEQIKNNPLFHIEDYRDKYVFSIDPHQCVDFDDAFSVESSSDQPHIRITVYIANVYLWIETLGLWDTLTDRVATIYLPDNKRPMLPSILSDNLCSLQAGELRFALAMEFLLDRKTNILIPSGIKNVLIQVTKNYVYEESALKKDSVYQTLFTVSRQISDSSIENSHDLVAYWMVKMNSCIAQHMVNAKIGIGRIVSSKKTDLSFPEMPNTISVDCARTIRLWKYNTKGEYVNNEVFPVLTERYLHITSPIRRLVDLLNQTVLQHQYTCAENTSPESLRFVEKWKTRIDALNESMRSTRKIQMECELMHRCFTQPDLLDTIHSGFVFEKVYLESKQKYEYMVYCEKIALMTRVTMEKELDNYFMTSFRLFLFENEDKTKKKIRLQYVDPI